MSKSSSRRMAGLVLALCSMAAAALLGTASPAVAETCSNEEFRIGPSAALPDCRAYELVTPPFKEAAAAGFETYDGLQGFIGMSTDGSHVAVTSTGNFGDSHGPSGGNNYELTRTASGWAETDIDMPVSRFPAATVALAEAHDEGKQIFASLPLQASPDFGKFLYYSPRNLDPNDVGSFWVGEPNGALDSLGPGEGQFVGASPDLSHVLFDGPSGLEEEDTAGGPPVRVGGQCGGVYSSPEGTGGFYDGFAREGTGGMSADGSVVFFYSGGCSSREQVVSEIFAWVEESRIVAVSEPSAADCSACDTSPGVQVSAEVIDGASADGSKVFFTTTQPLLGSDSSANIYEYDFDAPQASSADPDGRIVHVTAGQWGPGGAQVQSFVKVSEDGSHVYFVAAGALEGARNNQGEQPKEGESNLYVFERDAQFPSGRLSFIAPVAPGNTSVTPDGQFFVFTSSADLTPGDTSTARQVFEYDAETGDLVRVSIGQNGFNDNGNTDIFGAQIPPWSEHQEYMSPLAVSDNGAYVVFESSDGLTPGALNGYLGELEYELEGEKKVRTYYAVNVYEYHDGNVYLISDGQDTSYSTRSGEGERTVFSGSSVRLVGMSPSGEDVFFETADRLVPQDLDTHADLYDARIDGGFPAPVSLLPTCTSDACQGPLSPAPTLLSPGSEFQAGGNPPLAASEPPPAVKPKSKSKLAKCTKGHAQRKTKCVKKPKAKKAKAKKASNNRRASR